MRWGRKAKGLPDGESRVARRMGISILLPVYRSGVSSGPRDAARLQEHPEHVGEAGRFPKGVTH